MKYQSELIKEIVESRGHETPSFHYESECVESWIEETKGAYPKLCDYQSEWLNYINENPIGNFPYEIITDVTEATVNNVVPYEYKSAILKGQTLVNISEINRFSISGSAKKVSTSLKMIKSNTDYTRIVYITKNTLTGANEKNNVAQAVGLNDDKALFNQDRQIALNETGLVYNVCVNSGDLSSKLSASHVRIFSTNTGGILEGYEIIVEGDYTHQDIPFFTGMQSVKMPVLTTTGKNLFDGKIEFGGIYSNGNDAGNNQGGITDRVRSINYIPVNANTTYVLSDNEGNVVNANFYEYDENKNFIYTSAHVSSVNTQSSTKYIRFINRNTDTNVKYQLEEGTTSPTTYEPYKSNILTVNEDVTLRSNGSVCDELDLLTGKLTQRIDEGGEILTQEVVKTVELSIQDQDGNTLRKIKPIEGTMNIHSDGTPLKPTITMEIPVEATTQNLASFIKEE